MTTAASCVFQVSQPLQTENASAPEENTSTPTFNASHASTTAQSAQVKLTAVFAQLDCSFKKPNVFQDAISDSSSQVLSVKNVKMVALIVKELVPALSVKLEDMLTMDCAMLTAHLAPLLKPPT
jgi:hypothetical protein